MKIDVVAHIQAKPGSEAAVREVLQGFIAPTLKENGCLRYDLFVDAEDPTKFTFIEEWSSREALTAHSQSAHITAGRALMPNLLAGPSWVQVLTKASS
jgi:quinol monooxygenase YgiN